MRSPQRQQVTTSNDFINDDQRNSTGNSFRITDTTNEVLLNLERFELTEQANELQVELETLKIINWNASGLSCNLDRLIRKMKRETIHLAIVTETWFHPDRHIPDICVFNSIGAVTPNRNRGTNGVSVVINPDFENDPYIRNMTCISKDTVNGCFLAIDFAGIKIIGIYNAPSHPLEIDMFLDEVAMSTRLVPEEALILTGDFNARRVEWRDTASNSAGQKLKVWTESWNLERSDTGSVPTCMTVRGNSIVDHVFTNLSELTAQVGESPVALTDHKPIIMEFFPRASSYSQARGARTYMRIMKEKLQDREMRLQYALESMRSHNVLQGCIEEMESPSMHEKSINAQQQVIDSSDRIIRDFFLNLGKRVLGETTAGRRRQKYEPLQSELLDSLYAEHERAPSSTTTKAIANELCRLRRLRFENFADKLSSKPPTDVLKIIAQINASRRTRSSALQDNPVALAEYAEYFAAMTTNSYPESAASSDVLSLVLNADDARETAEQIFTTGKIFLILEDVPWNKTAGNSGVCYDLLKAADFSVISLIARWFRALFCLGLIPSSWTRSMIVPVPKKGDLNLIKNYRPISLTESLRKIFEHCMVRFLTPVAGPMHFSQGGFRSDHCCSDMITSLHEVLSKHKNMHVAFLDIKAAYDSVDRNILWKRCKSRGFDDNTIRILQRLFDHNSAQVVINGRRSNPFGIQAGLLQGSVLSPFLYSVFIDDLAAELSKHHVVKAGSISLNCTMYADDIAIFAKSAQVLQMLLTHCSRHANMNRYRFNVQKCAIIGDPDYEYRLEGHLIPKVDMFIYLGVEVGRQGIRFKDFIERRCTLAVEAGQKLVGMGMNLGGFTPQTASMLFKVFIRSKLEAGICLIPETKAIVRKLEAAQRIILARFFFCGPNSSGTIVRSLMNAPTMAFRMKYLRSRYVHRVLELNPDHIVQRTGNNNRGLIKKLQQQVFVKEECTGHGRERLKTAEMREVHATTCAATNGYLVINADGKIPWFLRRKWDPILRKRLCHWLLKKYPAAAPGLCGRCGDLRCTQVHVAECSELLRNICPSIPARFRPEFLVSNPESCLTTIAQAINFAVGRCLPQLRLL